MAKFFITGKNGMLAHAIVQHPFFKDQTAYTHQELDISDYNQLEKKILEDKPQIIINCAAYTNVTQAETDTIAALATNYLAVGHLAKICAKHKIKLIHFSTDYVFRGNTRKSFKEDSATFPINEYGLSKLAGEQKIITFLKDFLIIRVSWLYGKNGKNFVSTISKLIKEKDELNIVADQFGKTTYTKDVANILVQLIEKKQKGIFHLANQGVCSRYEFTQEIYNLMKEKNPKLKCQISAINGDDWPDPTPRPKYSVLNTDKLEIALNSKIRNWQTALKEYYFDF